MKIPLLALALVTSACAVAKPTVLPSDLKSPFTGYASAHYKDPASWLCLPGRTGDTCNGQGDLSATEIRVDGSRQVIHQEVAKSPDIDCFYVYPTVDMSLTAGNHDDFGDLAPMAEPAIAQAALFGQYCSLYAPLYRQVTIGTYLRGDRLEQGLQVAFSDVADAFLHYMGTANHGRKIVLLGHSQGAEMVKRLITRFFDDDPAMRAKLLVAIPLGGTLEVPHGQTTGGSFKNVPVCTKDDEVRCVVAFRTHRAGSDERLPEKAHADDREAICVNPGNLSFSGASATFHTYLPYNEKLGGMEGVTTPFVTYRDVAGGRCVDGPHGYRFLEITELAHAGEKRTKPYDLSSWIFNTKMGTHIADFQFAQGELLEMVKKRAGK